MQKLKELREQIAKVRKLQKMQEEYLVAKETLEAQKQVLSDRKARFDLENTELVMSIGKQQAEFDRLNTNLRRAMIEFFEETGEQEISNGLTVQKRTSIEIVNEREAINALIDVSPECVSLVKSKANKFIRDLLKNGESLENFDLSDCVLISESPTPVIKDVSVAT